ncbi:phosphatase PAP2 family protein [Actinomadura rupiterrae]|uniref:phosphatase PAP2 family protein n=1 Tax=Actinomadura rupiterrae TaxID=559627 RepID=UPI0020A273D9|nr:phosphatase PAP2 family protein [Actinomadura rupiterrae]MCP2336012.1 undecaprenyl-diphosphatase [Actinomadura rupiterrae]
MIDVAAAARLAGGQAFDAGLYRDVVAVSGHTGWLNGLVNWWSDYGLALFVVLAGVAWWHARDKGLRAAVSALWVPAAMILAFAVSSVLKLMVEEQRPCRAMPSVHIAVSCPGTSDYSFPSNHAVLAGAAAIAVWLAARRVLGAVAVVNALVIAGSRVYIGVHYPHDVAVGLLLGALVAAAGYYLLTKGMARVVPGVAIRG